MSIKSICNKYKERGAVSLFVVIFATLLITVLVVSFVRIMIRDQQTATTNDLSQSAYDSALAGVEDAKRALLRYQNVCQEDIGSVNCTNMRAAFNGDNCDALEAAGVVSFSDSSSGNKEVIIQSDAYDENTAETFDQAYTCVTMNLDTPDYQGSLAAGESKVIPLNSTGDFQSVRILWFTKADTDNLNLELSSADTTLPTASEWPANRPSLLRTQLIQYGSSFELDDFDESGNANTLFLYPSLTGRKEFNFVDDVRLTEGAPTLTQCQNSLSDASYACSATIKLPDPINGGNRSAYLRLSSLYNKTTFSVELLDSANNVVSFNGVQPEVDSTGRANDLFRRVVARIESRSDFTYPENAVDITGNLCKNFRVSTRAAEAELNQYECND